METSWPADRRAGWLGTGFLVLLLASEGALTLPDEGATASAVASFYAEHRAVIVALQVVGFVACALLAAMAWRLRAGDRRVSAAGLLVATAALAPGLVTLLVAVVADPRHPSSAARYNDLEPRGDDLLFLGIAVFGLAVVAAHRRVPLWVAVLGVVVAATSVLRLALEALGQERGALDALAPLTFLALVAALTWLSFRGSGRVSSGSTA
jgi:hypothetical protein